MTPPPDGPRHLLVIRGGTAPDDVAALTRRLASRLCRRGLLPASPLVAPATPAVDGSGTRLAPGPGASRHPPQTPPLLVPISPQEDDRHVVADLRRRLGPVGPATDLIVRTSGSTTGTGHLIAMSAAALAASARATHARLAGAGSWVLALPAHHIAGLQILVRSILAGTDPVVVDATAGFSPGALADAIVRALDRAAGTPVYTSLVPTQLHSVLAAGQERAATTLSGCAAVLIGGAAADPALLRRARAAGIRVVTTYGMSETGGGCVYDGTPLDGVAVRLEDTGPDSIGRIVLSGPVLAEGYADARRGDRGERGAGSWFRTPEGARAGGTGTQTNPAQAGGDTPSAAGSSGSRELVTADRGRIGADGRLEVLGRIDDLIITGGLKVDPRPVEETLTQLPGVAQACVLGLPDSRWGAAMVAAVVPEEGGRLDPEEVRTRARLRLGGVRAPKRVEVLDALPLRGPGKVDRLALAELLGAADNEPPAGLAAEGPAGAGPRAIGSRGPAGRTP